MPARRRDCDRSGSGGNLVIAAPGKLEHALQLRRIGGQIRVLLEFENQALGVGVTVCGAGLSSMFSIGGKEGSLGLALAGFNASRKPLAVGWKTVLAEAGSGTGMRGRGDPISPDQRDSPAATAVVEAIWTILVRVPPCRGCRPRGKPASRPCAEDGGPGFQVGSTVRLTGTALRSRSRKSINGPSGRRVGGGKLQRPSSHARRQCPLDVRRLAGVAGIFPVDVPARLQLEIKAALGGLRRRKLRWGKTSWT